MLRVLRIAPCTPARACHRLNPACSTRALSTTKNDTWSWNPLKKARLGVAVAGAALLSLSYNQNRDTHARGALVSKRKRWELYDEIGVGSFGTVCLGRCPSTGELAAVKIMEPEERTVGALHREIAALKLVKALGGHRNIVTLQDVYAEGRKVFLVTELVRGGELFDHLIAYGTFNEARAATISRDLGHALSFLHHHGIVHKDVKPENIMLESRDQNSSLHVKLVDFGSAGPASANDVADDIGTSAYLPPEMLQTGQCTSACDMWALGCVLYIMICGAHPFDLEGTANDAEVELRIKSGHAVFDHGVWTSVSAEAKDLVSRLLQKDPTLRPSADEVLQHPWIKQHTSATPLSMAITQNVSNAQDTKEHILSPEQATI